MAKKFDTEAGNPNRRLMLFQALADEKRMQLLSLLNEGEKNGVMLRKALDIPQSSLSYHIRLLCIADLVIARNQGSSTYYRLNRDICLDESVLLAGFFMDGSMDRGKFKGSGAFAADTFQEVRNSMQAILTDARLALNRLDDRENTRDCLGKIESAGERLLRYSDEILELARLYDPRLALQKKVLDLHLVAQEARKGIEKQTDDKGVDFDICYRNVRQYQVLCDGQYLNLALKKLLSNAVQFSEPGGRISLVIEQNGTGPDGLGKFRFSVLDEGCGMSEAVLAEACEPFVRETKHREEAEGVGLGLTAVRKLAELMEGTLELKSEKDMGTAATICLTLPVCES